MRVELKDFQTNAVCALLDRLEQMRTMYRALSESRTSVCLAAPTGSGKTVMCSAIIEALFFGSDELGVLPDERAVVIWLSDSPSLNDQTRSRFVDASDRLAQWSGDERHLETVTNNFCASHEELECRHVYFLSKDLLGRNGLLNKGGELNAGRVFWDVLDRTIKDPERNVYVFIDEAHRGLGLNSSGRDNSKTIYSNLIDGLDGRASAPMVVGVSATPQRFEQAMQGRRERIQMPPVQVTPQQVQESGLLKDTVELRVPEEDESVDHQYLTMACERFREACERWDAYCAEEDEPRVNPLLIVQVRDKIDKDGVKELCDQVMSHVPGLNPAVSFANVFGEHQSFACGKYQVRYFPPEQIQRETPVRVLFAKEAVSNGWDCPRAEVIFSERRRSEPTYIAQLIGRMVRTPLARRVEADEFLNSVACYLPRFNPAATHDVVDYLTGKKDDIGGSAVQDVVVTPVRVVSAKPRAQEDYDLEMAAYEANRRAIAEWRKRESGYQPALDEAAQEAVFEAPSEKDAGQSAVEHVSSGVSSAVGAPDELAADSLNAPASTGMPADRPSPMRPPARLTARDQSFTKEVFEEIERAFFSIPVRRIPKKARNQFKSLLDTATLLVDAKWDRDAPDTVNERFSKRLAFEISDKSDAYLPIKHDVEMTNTHTVILDMLHDNEVIEKSEEVVTDDEGIASAAREADPRFGGKELTNAFRKRMFKNGVPEREVNLMLASAVRVPDIMASMEAWAAGLQQNYIDKVAPMRDMAPERIRQRFDEIEQVTTGSRIRRMEWPNELTLDGDWPSYPKHILQDETGMCPLKLNDTERYVVLKELDRPYTVAFYRNPSNYSPSVFSIPYVMPSGRMSLRPDFIFFVRSEEDGKLYPSIVDPHGAHLSDTIPKLRGYVEYLREFPGVFKQVLAVSDFPKRKEYRALNLLRPDVQDAIVAFQDVAAEALFLDGGLSFKYGDIG
ncbi:DEAD/DEAH box helicase family protein [Collinsella tanakaei]|uniref:DEAD/DEAH box helicase n=1 Tax=Collinsella tanakaei TaxID=626935 RepID=UPI0019575951|nr:DEAD/DEAH box helicase family protein [Collinsella tanakaei]MBM6779789.1 DEAD/DEAH box helicase family protein [Collinsella tanakaei]